MLQVIPKAMCLQFSLLLDQVQNSWASKSRRYMNLSYGFIFWFKQLLKVFSCRKIIVHVTYLRFMCSIWLEDHAFYCLLFKMQLRILFLSLVLSDYSILIHDFLWQPTEVNDGRGKPSILISRNVSQKLMLKITA